MAKNSLSIDALCRQIAEDAAHGRFSPIYLLMGDEPYYPELVCREIQRHCTLVCRLFDWYAALGFPKG